MHQYLALVPIWIRSHEPTHLHVGRIAKGYNILDIAM